MPIDIEFNLLSSSYGSLYHYQNRLQQQLRQAYSAVREHPSAEQSRQKRLYDRSVYGPKYEVGDEVWLHSPAVPKGCCNKFHRPWQGPLTVVKVMDMVFETTRHLASTSLQSSEAIPSTIEHRCLRTRQQ